MMLFWKNKNKLLSTYEYNIGGKTGFTEKARRTLVTASQKDEKTCKASGPPWHVSGFF